MPLNRSQREQLTQLLEMKRHSDARAYIKTCIDKRNTNKLNRFIRDHFHHISEKNEAKHSGSKNPVIILTYPKMLFFLIGFAAILIGVLLAYCAFPEGKSQLALSILSVLVMSAGMYLVMSILRNNKVFQVSKEGIEYLQFPKMRIVWNEILDIYVLETYRHQVGTVKIIFVFKKDSAKPVKLNYTFTSFTNQKEFLSLVNRYFVNSYI